MSRATIIKGIAALAALALVTGLVFVRRSARSANPDVARSAPDARAPATVSALDPTWCGTPFGAAGPGDLGDASDCGKLSFTGSAPDCLFWAECREARFQIDCTSAGPERCHCDGENGLTVPYDPAFCALDADHPQRSLRAILDRAAVACRWTSR